jgi:hypothetical protein
MRLIICLLLLLNLSEAAIEKDLNLAALKKAYTWLISASEEETAIDPNKSAVDLSNVESVWNAYKEIMKQSIVLIRKYPKKIQDKLPTLLNHENKDILPLIAFYLYAVERQDKTLRYYDAFNVMITPVNQDNLWVAVLPFTDSKNPKFNNYSVLILDMKHQRLLTKD